MIRVRVRVRVSIFPSLKPTTNLNPKPNPNPNPNPNRLGVILDSTSQDWDVVFRGTACVYFLGAAYYASNYEARKLF
jgi:hypothetical protein